RRRRRRRTAAAAAATLVPPWLEPLLATQFFSACPDHADAARSECNMFCLDCRPSPPAFCFYCRSDIHPGHRVIQIRRSSYHDVVRVAEVEKALDIGGVQTYVINSARVLFLNERPQPRGGGAAAAGKAASSTHYCEICARALLDPFRFCSLGCKLVRIKRNGDASFTPTEASASGSGSGGGDGDDNKAEGGKVTGGSGERIPQREETRVGADTARATRSLPNSRRRKGVPHRAPFFAS
ncbi:hypothetical protein ACMD2_12837, partial [Ananas comosus]